MYIWGAIIMAMDGLISIKPSSASGTGASATVNINDDGGVDWVAVDQLTIDGVFTSDFDNYLVAVNYKHSNSANVNFLYRLMQNGVLDNSSSYISQLLSTDTISVVRVTANYGWVGYSSPIANGFNMNLYGPSLSEPTAARSVTVGARLSGYPHVSDWASTVNSSTQYTGIRLYTNSSDSGNIHVFGWKK